MSTMASVVAPALPGTSQANHPSSNININNIHAFNNSANITQPQIPTTTGGFGGVAATAAAPPPNPAFQSCAPHGKKRPAETSLENEQRLSKRFDLLNLIENNGTRLYIPVPGSSDPKPTSTTSPTSTSTIPPKPLPPTSTPTKHHPPRTKPKRHTSLQESDGMQIEDTPHRVYIHDLAAELSDIESDEENPIFLSDIEKHLSKIPKHVLQGTPEELKATKDNQLVLYNVPNSLTVPEEQDRVRKAIVEARARIREGQGNFVGEPDDGGNEVRLAESGIGVGGGDPDAMDLD